MRSSPDSDDPNPTVRERMEALGWNVAFCEDTCAIGWQKVDPATRQVIGYQDGGTFNRDLEECQRAYGYLDGKSYYA